MTKAVATMTAGQTACVMDGTYTEDIVRFNNSGTASNRITLKAQNSRKAILASLAPNSCQPSFNVHGSYITIEGIRVMASPNASTCTTYGSGMAFRFWHTDTVIIGGIQSTGTVGGVMRDVQVDFNPSFSMSAKTSQDDMLVENSTFYGELEAFNSNHVIYRNNVIYNGGPNGNYISGKGGVRNMLLYGNVLHMTTVASPASWQLGLSCGQVSGPQWDYDPVAGWESYNCAAFNNVVINETGSGSVNGMGPQGALDSWFFNNVFLGGAYFQNRTGGAGTMSKNVTLMNNIFSCSGNQAVSVTPAGSFTVDYNNFFNCSGAPSQTHAITGDPKLTADWHLGTAMTGTPMPTIPAYGGGTLDTSRNKDGVVRTAPWNVGVY
jgi:hypothetical protein